jgi:hypothetical protein
MIATSGGLILADDDRLWLPHARYKGGYNVTKAGESETGLNVGQAGKGSIMKMKVLFVMLVMTCLWVTIGIGALPSDGPFGAATPTACSAQEPVPPAITAQDAEAVEARLAELSALGITVPQEGGTPPPQSYMTEGILAVDSREGFAVGFGQWVLVLADGLERVEFHFTRAAGDEGYAVFNIRTTKGQWLFVPGEDPPETFAVEFGNVIKFVDPVQARLEMDIKVLEALDATEPQEFDPKFAQMLAPGAIDLNSEGVSAYVVDGDLVMIVNKGSVITNVFWSPIEPTAASGSGDPSPEGQSELMAGPSTAVQAAKVCARLFQFCITHEDDLGLRACIAWLQYCGPPRVP